MIALIICRLSLFLQRLLGKYYFLALPIPNIFFLCSRTEFCKACNRIDSAASAIFRSYPRTSLFSCGKIKMLFTSRGLGRSILGKTVHSVLQYVPRPPFQDLRNMQVFLIRTCQPVKNIYLFFNSIYTYRRCV